MTSMCYLLFIRIKFMHIKPSYGPVTMKTGLFHNRHNLCAAAYILVMLRGTSLSGTNKSIGIFPFIISSGGVIWDISVQQPPFLLIHEIQTFFWDNG